MFTCWPPAPEERNTCISISAGFILTSAVSISGRTATVAVEVWTLPPDSVSGTRWTRWTPLSNLNRDQAPSPSTVKTISFTPPSSVSLAESTSMCQPLDSAYMEYIRNREWANRAASSPPTPARISTMTFLPSLGSRGRRRICSSRSSRGRSSRAAWYSSWASSLSSGSDIISSACRLASSVF